MYCDRCKPGYFGLKDDIEKGCLPCYCSQVTTLCESALIKNQSVSTYLNTECYRKTCWNYYLDSRRIYKNSLKSNY